MKNLLKKSRLLVAVASLFGSSVPMVQAADLVPVQPTVAVVDENHQAINWANTLLNAFLARHQGASINEISFFSSPEKVDLTIGGFNADGVYKAVFSTTTNDIKENRIGDFNKSVEKTAFNPENIIPPAAAVNYAYAQAEGKATSLLSWSVKSVKGQPQYEVVFGAADNKTIKVVFEAGSGKLLEVKK